MNVRTSVVGLRERQIAERHELEPDARAEPIGWRQVHFGSWMEVPIYERERLRPGTRFTGPAIVEQADTTTVIEPDMHARVDDYGNLLVEVA
ncbi:MAG: hypothetical protein ICV72_15405 [Aldersonia sp.]|nr:hypothetical protein [Aldersonia sp.]